jgi:predicted XRE-type DNA-binding protein
VRFCGNDCAAPNAEGQMLKAQIALYLSKRIKQLALTQQKAAELMSIRQLDISNILRGKLEPFSMDRLLEMLKSL